MKMFIIEVHWFYFEYLTWKSVNFNLSYQLQMQLHETILISDKTGELKWIPYFSCFSNNPNFIPC